MISGSLKRTDEAIEDLREFFRHYYYTHLQQDNDSEKHYQLKYNHSLRVAGYCITIAEALHLSETEISLAYITGLLHDIGRFDQLKRYGTFNDAASTDHASLSCQVIKSHKILHFLSPGQQQDILTAIENHNKIAVDQNVKGFTLQLSRLIRDADKTDIYQVVTDYYAHKQENQDARMQLGLPDTGDIHPEFLQRMHKHQLLDIHQVKNLNELKLLQISWIFDINYKETLQLIHHNHSVEKIFASLPAKQKNRQLKQDIVSFIEQKIK